MPKKKPIDKRLKTLFEDVKPEQAPAEFRPASGKRVPEEIPQPPAETPSQLVASRPVEVISHRSQPNSGLSLAFQAGQDSWATLQVIDEATERQWTQDEQLLVKQVADQLSLALENARLFQETQTRAEELSVLNEMARELSAKLEVSEIAAVVYRYTTRLMDTSNFFFALYDEKKEEKNYPLVFEEGERVYLSPAKLSNQGFSDYIIRNKKAVFAPNDVLGYMKALGIAFIPLNENDTPSQCWLGVPMMIGERVLGLISVQHVQEANVYDEHDRDILTTIASQAAIAIENARLLEETQLRADETARLNKLVTKVAETLDLQKNLQIIADEIADYTSALHVGIALIEKEQNVLILSADAPLREDQSDIGIRIPIAGNPTAEPVINNREPLFVNDTLNDPATAHIAGIMRIRGTQSLFVWPIVAGREVIGTLGIDFADPYHQLPERQKDLINTILFQTSTSIQNARLFQETQDSEAELRALFASMNDVIIVYDKEGYYVRIAPTNPSLLVRPPQEMVGKNIQEILPAELVGQFTAVIQEALKTNEIIKIEYPLTIAGNHLWFDANVSKLNEDQVFWVARDITDRKIHELTQAALNQISESALSSRTLDELFASFHAAIRLLVPADNFYIAQYEPGTNLLTFPYHASKVDEDWSPRRRDKGLTSHVLRTGKPLRVTPEILAELEASGQVSVDNARGVDWLGVPLRSKQVVTGVVAIQTYDDDIHITERHQEILSSLASQLASVIERFLAEREIQKFKLGIDRSDNPVFITDLDGTIQYANPAFQRVYGFSLEETIGKTPRVLISHMVPAEEYRRFWSTLLAGGTVSGEVINQTKDGRLIPIAATNTPILDENGEILGFLALHQDITERKLSEEALRESDARTRLILETAIDGFITIDSRSVITEWNPQAAQIFGWTREEAVGQNLADLIIPQAYRDAHRRGLEHYLATGEGSVLNQRIEITGLHRDGHLFPIELAIASIPSAGKSTFSAFVRDITERKRAEEAIRRQNEYLAVSAEIGRLVTSTLDLNTIFSRTVSLISERFGFYHSSIFTIEETGFSAVLREATGEAGEKMKVAKHTLAVGPSSIVGKAANSGEPVVVNNVEQERLHRPNPLLLDTLSEAAIPLRIGTRIVGVIDIQSTQTDAFTPDDIAVLQSLADQVAVAIDNARSFELSQQLIHDLREIDLLKSQFLANMSHELRTPLNSIIGFSRVILKGIDGPVTEMQQQDLTAIYNSGQHLLGLINDILDLARIEAGKMELNFEEVHLAEMTTSVMSTAKGLVKEKPIQLLQRIPENMPTVRGDAMRVRQVLLNLISNAAKFTEAGSITVESIVQKGPTGKPEALINVVDTGPGISAEDQKKLFQAFSQVDGSATRKTGGTGLGLSICANLVQLHGGRIGVHSGVGKGSVFWFTLPLYHHPEELIPEGKKIILAIDDDPQVIGLYERYLTPQGYYVLALTDPLKAKEQILKVRPYAITLDVMMPNKDGWSVLTELKSDPATRDYPVIICSILEQADRGFSLGAADYLVKPILEEELVDALDRLNKDGNIHEVLVIDDDPNDLRLVEKILKQHGRYRPILAQGGLKGWEAINRRPPQAIILDLFMPEMDGFHILERLRETPRLRDIPVLIVSGGGLTVEQQERLKHFGQRLIAKGSLNESQLIAMIENSLKQLGS